jgi:hypothetical protein
MTSIAAIFILPRIGDAPLITLIIDSASSQIEFHLEYRMPVNER